MTALRARMTLEERIAEVLASEIDGRNTVDDLARAVVAVLPTADVSRIGERVQDGGEWGTIVRCHECNGQGVLHRLDVQPMPTEPTGGTA